MSEERLSKLQKSILRYCYEKGKSFIERKALLKEYMKNTKIGLNSAEVTLTKSLKNLRDKDYVEVLDTEYNSLLDHSETFGLQGCDETLHKVKYVSLTEKGIRKATQSPLEKT